MYCTPPIQMNFLTDMQYSSHPSHRAPTVYDVGTAPMQLTLKSDFGSRSIYLLHRSSWALDSKRQAIQSQMSPETSALWMGSGGLGLSVFPACLRKSVSIS